MITGSIVALVTPMHPDGAIDWSALARLIEYHIESGTAGLGVVGTTGESPTLTVPEHCEVIRFAVEQAGGRIPVVAGTGGNSTHEAIELTVSAAEAGADYSLSVTPYYNKPTQAGLYAHFKAVAESTSLPIFIYNIPGRSVIDMTVDTMARLAELPNIRTVLLIGQYAQARYLGKRRKSSMTDTVAHWRDYAPRYWPMPHPSWRNNGWLKKHGWFEADLLPALRAHIAG